MPRKLGLLLVVLLALLLVLPAGASAKKVLIKTQSLYPTAMSVLGEGVVWFANAVKAASGDEINFKVYEPGKLVPGLEVLESVSKGRIEAGYAGAGFWAGKLPAAPVFSSVPFGPEAPEYMAWMRQGNGLKLDQEMYDKAGYNVKVFPLSILAPETSGWFRKEINTVDDLKGLKMRFYGLGGQAMQKLGASVSVLPTAEIFPALEKGALDATEFSMPSLDKMLGFYKVCKYNYYPGWHQQATFVDLLINKDFWEKSLTEPQRKLIEMAVLATNAQTLAMGEAAQAPVIKENIEKHGVQIRYWSPELLAAFKKAWEEVCKEQYAKDEMFKKAWDDLSAFRKVYAYWSNLGFMPREVGKLEK